MTIIQRRTFALAPKPWNTMRWVRVPDGLEFPLYDITTVMWSNPVVDATADEEARWKRAHDAFEAELRDAQSAVRWAHGLRTKNGFMADNRTVRLRRYDLVPGRKSRSRQAWQDCATRMHAAAAVYLPVREEIEARLAQAAATGA